MRRLHPRSKELFEQLSSASSREERIEILQQARRKARVEFPRQLAKLENLLLQSNPYIILATFAYIDLTYLPDVGRAMSDSGEIDQYHIELVQALILCHSENEFQKRPFDPPQFQELRDLTSYVAHLHSIKDIPDPDDMLPEGEIAQLHFCSMLRAHTKAVRNWGYEAQAIGVLKELYKPLEDAIEKELGVRASFVIDAIRSQLQAINQRLQEHSDKVRTFMRLKTVEVAVDAYLKAFPDTQLSIGQANRLITHNGWTFENIQVLLFHRSISFLLTVFALDIAEFYKAYPAALAERIKQMFLGWSFQLGELHVDNKEHLFLDNPIWKRPLIRATSNILFWPIPTLFHGFCFDMIEAFVCQSPDLKKKLLKRRGQFLEQYTAQLFQRKFPDAVIFKGSKWENKAMASNGENDLLIIFDSIALVIEEKSGAINPIAKRGGPSIKQEIEQLITQASEQAHAFAQFLQNNPGKHAFATSSGAINQVDVSNIEQFHCLSITLERFGPLATQFSELQAVGLARKDVPPILTMSVADLEIALELFRTPFELMHYITRRAAFALRREFIGDELDLVAYYLQTGFSAKVLPDRSTRLIIDGLGGVLDQFLINWPGDPRFERPQRKLSKWWQEILSAIEVKQVHRRYELGCLLLDMPDEEQHAFEAQFKDLRKIVNGHTAVENLKAIWNHVPSDVSSAVIVAAPVNTDIYPNRDMIVQNLAIQTMEETGANQAIILLVDVELEHWPYSGIYLLDKDDFRQRQQNGFGQGA